MSRQQRWLEAEGRRSSESQPSGLNTPPNLHPIRVVLTLGCLYMGWAGHPPLARRSISAANHSAMLPLRSSYPELAGLSR